MTTDARIEKAAREIAAEARRRGYRSPESLANGHFQVLAGEHPELAPYRESFKRAVRRQWGGQR